MNSHLEMPVVLSGAPLEEASGAALLIHGRNQEPKDMLTLVEQLKFPSINYVIPTAKEKSWYTNKFMEDPALNEPGLSNALEVIDRHLESFELNNLPLEQQILIGFSQGACLVSEYLCRYKRRPKYVFILTGGYQGSNKIYKMGCTLKGTEIYISNGDKDPWVPLNRTIETTELFANNGANVNLKVFPERPHEISIHEVNDMRRILNDSFS